MSLCLFVVFSQEWQQINVGFVPSVCWNYTAFYYYNVKIFKMKYFSKRQNFIQLLGNFSNS